ncbi:MAG: hypothetical protein B6D63_00890 [Candidatus Latescibacteria bacterium 4484_7]|nr:MAG: hypothetical protein B6D63_00890 [Candidatus Latescibacteria bacterium 4484_7]
MIEWKDKRDFWIIGAKVVDPEAGKVRAGSILIQKGLVTDIVWQKSVETDLPVLDASGYYLSPGFIDIHTHLREPGYEEKETVETGTAAAAAGGFTSVVSMANTDPVADEPSVIEFILSRAEAAGKCRVYPVAAVTKGLKGEQLNEYYFLKKAGAVALSDDGNYILNSQVMRNAFEYAGYHDLTIISHCEDPFLTEYSLMNESFSSTRLGMRGAPAASEEIAIARDIALAQLTGSRLHIAHVSTQGGVELIKAAKKKGIPVTAEVTPHHLTLDETMLDSYDSNLKVNPPLRSKKDISALRQALKDGIIDCIATDHAPHNEIDKQVEFDRAPSGMIGFETAFAQLNTELVASGVIELVNLVRFMTVEPARILGLPGGKLEKEAPADLVLFDPFEEWTLKKRMIRSKSKNTPLIGKSFTGKVAGTFLGGRWIPND